MSALACDRCDRSLLAFEDVRYELTMIIKAAYDPMEIVPGQTPTDLGALIEQAARATEGMSEEEVEATVYKELHFDLCLRCQRELLRDPLPRRAPDGQDVDRGGGQPGAGDGA
ncbi:MAG: hypothetical protein AB7N76_08825 [Planctomycetota bacterium]